MLQKHIINFADKTILYSILPASVLRSCRAVDVFSMARSLPVESVQSRACAVRYVVYADPVCPVPGHRTGEYQDPVFADPSG